MEAEPSETKSDVSRIEPFTIQDVFRRAGWSAAALWMKVRVPSPLDAVMTESSQVPLTFNVEWSDADPLRIGEYVDDFMLLHSALRPLTKCEQRFSMGNAKITVTEDSDSEQQQTSMFRIATGFAFVGTSSSIRIEVRRTWRQIVTACNLTKSLLPFVLLPSVHLDDPPPRRLTKIRKLTDYFRRSEDFGLCPPVLLLVCEPDSLRCDAVLNAFAQWRYYVHAEETRLFTAPPVQSEWIASIVSRVTGNSGTVALFDDDAEMLEALTSIKGHAEQLACRKEQALQVARSAASLQVSAHHLARSFADEISALGCLIDAVSELDGITLSFDGVTSPVVTSTDDEFVMCVNELVTAGRNIRENVLSAVQDPFLNPIEEECDGMVIDTEVRAGHWSNLLGAVNRAMSRRETSRPTRTSRGFSVADIERSQLSQQVLRNMARRIQRSIDCAEATVSQVHQVVEGAICIIAELYKGTWREYQKLLAPDRP